MNRKLSRSERVNAVLAGQKVEEFKARHAYLHGINHGPAEYCTFWLRSDNSTFGHTFGRMMGFQEIVAAFLMDAVLFRGEKHPVFGPCIGPTMGMTTSTEEANPFSTQGPPRTDRPTKAADIFGKLELYGHPKYGTFGQSAHALCSPVVEVADDGKSARSFYLTPGPMMSCNGDQGGRSSGYLWERYGSDFVFRDGRWWWFHEQVCPDFMGQLDLGNWGQDRFTGYLDGTFKPGKASAAPDTGISDCRDDAHRDVSIIQTVQDTTPPPKPYAKLDEENTYSPGCSDFSGKIYPSSQTWGDYLY